MKITITERKENLLLQRTEIQGKITFKGATPSNAQLAEALAQELKIEMLLIVVKQIITEFGQQEASFTAVAYKNQDAHQKAEVMTKHLRKKAEESKKEAPAEESKPEPKAEEPKEKDKPEEATEEKQE